MTFVDGYSPGIVADAANPAQAKTTVNTLAADSGRPLIELRQVSKTFGTVKALEQLEVSIRPGELVTVVGPSGCGKSTLFNILAGLEEPDPGNILRQLIGMKKRGYRNVLFGFLVDKTLAAFREQDIALKGFLLTVHNQSGNCDLRHLRPRTWKAFYSLPKCPPILSKYEWNYSRLFESETGWDLKLIRFIAYRVDESVIR